MPATSQAYRVAIARTRPEQSSSLMLRERAGERPPLAEGNDVVGAARLLAFDLEERRFTERQAWIRHGLAGATDHLVDDRGARLVEPEDGGGGGHGRPGDSPRVSQNWTPTRAEISFRV